MEFEDIPKLASITKYHVTKFFNGLKPSDDIIYYHKLAGACFDSGASYVSVGNDGEINGHVLGVKQPNIWNNIYTELNVFTIHSYGASSFAMGKMLMKFADRCEYLLNSGEITRAVVTSNSKTNVNYHKLGFKKVDERYSMEIQYGY